MDSMRCPACGQPLTGLGKVCLNCGWTAKGRVSAESDVDIELLETRQDKAPDLCPYCRFPIEGSRPVIRCPQCGTPHHRECWQENGGCTTYGCSAGPSGLRAARATLMPPYPREYQPYRVAGRPLTSSNLPRTIRYQLHSQANSAITLAIWALLTSTFSFVCCGALLSPLLMLLASYHALATLAKYYLSRANEPGVYAKAIAALVVTAIALVVLVVISRLVYNYR